MCGLIILSIIKYVVNCPIAPDISGVRATRSLVLYVCFIDLCSSFCNFSFGHCVVLRYTESDYPFGIFKLFLWKLTVEFAFAGKYH